MSAGNGGSTGNWYGEGYDATNYAASNFPQWLGFGYAKLQASATAQHCGLAANGCVRVSGGLAEGRFDYWTFIPDKYGWGEAHTYDPCGAVNPPPYFPTTGRFIPSRYYEIDPVWLNSIGIGNYFAKLQSQ